MLENLVNVFLLVYKQYTSNNETPFTDMKQDYQQERLVDKVSDDYLIGFVEGEGCFYIGIVKSKETITGWQVVYFFKVSQNPSGKIVLEKLKD